MLARAHRGSASAIATSAIQKVLSSAFQAIQRVPLGVRFQGSSTATSGGSDGSIVTGSKPLVQMFTKKECSLCVPVNEAILDAKVKLVRKRTSDFYLFISPSPESVGAFGTVEVSGTSGIRDRFSNVFERVPNEML